MSDKSISNTYSNKSSSDAMGRLLMIALSILLAAIPLIRLLVICSG